jgi:hypothetical protein
MNYDEYTYTELDGYKNVFRQERKDNVADQGLLAAPLVPLIDTLVAKRPKWKFVAARRAGLTRVPDGTAILTWTFVEVYENNEKLGEIDYTYSHRDGENKIAYCYDNHRLMDKRKRGSWTKTTKMDKAVKEILKLFRPKDTTEIVRSRMELVAGVVEHTKNFAGHNFLRSYSNLRDRHLSNFVMSNWDILVPLLEKAEVPYDPNLPDHYASAEKAKAMAASLETDGVTILVRANDYIVVQATGDVEIKTSEELPSEVRSKLGMLKLTEVKQYIPDIGIRCAPDTYFISGKDSK